jgi:hypothetical protein
MLCGDIMLSSELLDAVHSLSEKDRASLLGYLHSLRAPKPVDENGQTRNPRRLTLIDRRSILYLNKFAEPRATPTELAAIFGVSQQRVSQILGARGHKSPDAALINAFNNARPSDLRDGWFNFADLERLSSFRAGKIAASPIVSRNMASAADPLGRWSALRASSLSWAAVLGDSALYSCCIESSPPALCLFTSRWEGLLDPDIAADQSPAPLFTGAEVTARTLVGLARTL